MQCPVMFEHGTSASARSLPVFALRHRNRDAAFDAASRGIALLVKGLQLVTGLRPVLLLLSFGTALGFPYFVGAFANTLFVSHLLTLAVLAEAPLQSVSARLGAFTSGMQQRREAGRWFQCKTG